MLNVTEIFTSLQGESTLAGYPCTFVRLAECNLRCAWCDTTYSHDLSAAKFMTLEEIISEVSKFPVKLVEITGGEPLLQSESVRLCEELLEHGYRVMIETNGSLDISVVPQGVRRIVDVKCPDSGCGGSFLLDNLQHICDNDELKFVVASINDCEWAKNFCASHDLTKTCTVTFSPVNKKLSYNKLADWLIANCTDNIRLGLQLHKIIWGDKRGV